jgi:polyisoprenoid-binding protein YceI
MHSTVGFAATLIHAVKVRGRFTDYEGTIIYDQDHPERSSVSAVIRTKSINTDMDFRDNHLRSPDFFDVKTYPTIEFTSDRVIPRRGGATVFGTLRMHGVSKRVRLPAKLVLAPYTSGSAVGVAFSAELRLSRKDYGIAGTNAFNPDYDPVTSVLGDSVDVLLELDAIRQSVASWPLGGGTPPGVADTVNRVLRKNGVDAAIAAYRQLRATQPTAFDYAPWQLDLLGQQVAERGNLPGAIAILQLNASQFADSAWVLETLALTQAQANDTVGALATYRRALEKSPHSPHAREMVRHLELLTRASAQRPGSHQ